MLLDSKIQEVQKGVIESLCFETMGQNIDGLL